MAQPGQQMQNSQLAEEGQSAPIERHDTKITQDDAERPIFIVVPGIMGRSYLFARNTMPGILKRLPVQNTGGIKLQN